MTWVCTNEKYVTCLRKMLPCPVFQDLFWFMVKSQHEWQSKYVVQSHRMLLQYFLSLFDLWLRHLNLINQKVSLLRYLGIWKMFYLFFGQCSSHDLKMLFRKNRINANRQQIFKINAFFERSAKSMYQIVFLKASMSTEIF